MPQILIANGTRKEVNSRVFRNVVKSPFAPCISPERVSLLLFFPFFFLFFFFQHQENYLQNKQCMVTINFKTLEVLFVALCPSYTHQCSNGSD